MKLGVKNQDTVPYQFAKFNNFLSHGSMGKKKRKILNLTHVLVFMFYYTQTGVGRWRQSLKKS